MPASITLETIMKEKKKLTYKQQQKREKAKTIVKWVFCGLGWSLLATAFISLLVVGIRGCNNKKQPAQALTGQVTTPVKPVQPHDVAINVDSSNDKLLEGGLASVVSFLGANSEGTSHAVYTWERGVNDDPHDLSTIGNVYFLSGDLVGSCHFEETGGNTHDFNIDTIRHEANSNTIDFYNDGVQVYALDERDWSQATKWRYLRITMTARTINFIDSDQVLYVNAMTIYDNGLRDLEYILTDFFVKDVVDFGGSSTLGGVFDLISQAFGSFVNLFNYQIIPGITIGTFIALPLVATAIFFIVKLFKR